MAGSPPSLLDPHRDQTSLVDVVARSAGRILHRPGLRQARRQALDVRLKFRVVEQRARSAVRASAPAASRRIDCRSLTPPRRGAGRCRGWPRRRNRSPGPLCGSLRRPPFGRPRSRQSSLPGRRVGCASEPSRAYTAARWAPTRPAGSPRPAFSSICPSYPGQSGPRRRCAPRPSTWRSCRNLRP